MTPPDQGSIYEAVSNGRPALVAQLDFGYVAGQRKRRRKYVALPDTTGLSARAAKRLYDEAWKAAEVKLAELVAERDGGLPADLEKQTVGQYLDTWLRDVVARQLRPTTHRTYSDLVRLHIAPAIGHVRLRALRPQHVRAMLNGMSSAGLSTSMTRQARAVLRRAIEQAVEDQLLDRNPVAAVRRDREPRQARPILTAEAVRTLLTQVHGDRLEALLLLAVTTGIRKGELRGLRWSAVNLDTGEVLIREQLQRVEVGTAPAGSPRAGQRIYEERFVPLKSSAKSHAIALAPSVVDALRHHRDRQRLERRAAGTAWDDRWNLVLCRPDGRPLDQRSINTWFERQLEAAGMAERDAKGRRVNRMRWHDLRHTVATLLAGRGVEPARVRDALGHANIAVTMDVYTERLPDAQRVVAATMESIVTGSTDEESSELAR